LKKTIFIILMQFTLYINSLEVESSIIESVKSSYIEFNNYIGPHLFYNTIDEIRSIGSYLANDITPNVRSSGNYNNKYIINHFPKTEWEIRELTCDIFEISNTALIDNSNNIELIISQYLIDNYKYNLDDADLLAHLILVYNAVYRGDYDHYSTIYTSESRIESDASKLGIDVNYSKWPGNTFIYIPLSDKINIGKLDSINSDILIEDEVIKRIKLQDENSIELREQIVDFKEKELDEITTDLDNKKSELEILESSVDSSNTDKNIETIENSEEILNDNSEKIITLQSEVVDKEVLIEKKEEQITKLRDNLAEDKNSLIKSTTNDNKKYYTFILNRSDAENYFGQLVNLDDSGAVINRSSINSVRNNKIVEQSGFTYFIAGGNKSNQIITLGKVNSRTLELVKWATANCFESSDIIFTGNKLYSLIIVENRYYIGEFDTDLNLVRRSAVSLNQNSYIINKSGSFYIQGDDNNIKLINLSDFISEE